jgi:hypothetical protein
VVWIKLDVNFGNYCLIREKVPGFGIYEVRLGGDYEKSFIENLESYEGKNQTQLPDQI